MPRRTIEALVFQDPTPADLPMRCCLVLALASLAACSDLTIRRYPIGGYARVEGSVQRAQASRDPVELTLSCGRRDPNEIASAPAVRADSSDAYRLLAAVPGQEGPVADSGEVFLCRLRASMLRGFIGADTILTVRFVPKLDDVSPVVVDLRMRTSQ